MEVKIFSVELTGVMGQNLRKLESDINAFLADRECVAMEQSIFQDNSANKANAGKTRMIVTVVAKKKSAV